MNLTELSKTISHALRHEPWIYELEIDAQGWVSIDELLNALKECSPKWQKVSIETLKQIIDASEKKRFEIIDNKIRAMYGHSIPEKISLTPAEPPEILFHGSTKKIAETILKEGLRPMGRQYVHLSTDISIAKEVAKRKGEDIVILQVFALKAANSGNKFYSGNKYVWLCNALPAEFIEIYL